MVNRLALLASDPTSVNPFDLTPEIREAESKAREAMPEAKRFTLLLDLADMKNTARRPPWRCGGSR
jgi:hypothetical protein